MGSHPTKNRIGTRTGSGHEKASLPKAKKWQVLPVLGRELASRCVGELLQTSDCFTLQLVHFGFDGGDVLPASCSFFARPRLSAYSLPSIGATCGGSLSRYGRPIPSSCSWASIHRHNFSLEA